ncbi:hypothetical protein QUF61_17135 [Candidatus Venteria ishoeyi]|uniref:hypothetical protein n=1 Tax=Candidatus Venteria ishoeyi TaxID=1899563 RepID=UPI0025A612FA|nr:hypothetical protein [Candidatus Venteria ishoeyi]MDM8548217.1 hypothetical protein [Candidatus Venteria ishoeyi]
MSKNSRRNKKRTSTPNNPNNPNNPKLELDQKHQTEAKQLNDIATEQATETLLESAIAVGKPTTANSDDLCTAVEQAKQAQHIFEALKKETESEKNKLEKQQADLEARISGIKEREQKQQKKQQEINNIKEAQQQEQVCLQQQAKSLDEQEQDIKNRELNAEAGFTQQRHESLSQLEKEAQILRETMSNHRQKILEERSEFEIILESKQNEFIKNQEAKRNKLESDYQKELQKIDKESLSLLKEEAKLNKKHNQLKWDIESLKEDKQSFNEYLEKSIIAEKTEFESKLHSEKQRLIAVEAYRDQLERKLRTYEEAERRIGNRSPEEVFQELESVRKERDEAKAELATRPDHNAQKRLQKLENLYKDAQQRDYEQQQQIQALKRQRDQNQIAVTELEALREQKQSLKSSNDLLQAALEDLRKDVDERIRRADGVSPFPACIAMDSEEAHQTKTSLHDEEINLKTFSEDLRQRVAYDRETQKELFYSQRDIRSFLAGLAMSHLHLLQGISGTGKTSLPLAMARALGAGDGLIEIQAGWRDRHDLVGHFNAFERRFYESEFLQALYLAQCPQYQDRLFFIVLDEMNLSHPEQYFADFISALEQEPQNRILTLMESAVAPAPDLFTEGRKLKIPENIWFIGTANHDETTVDFAPKTYDRAHVMELPRHQEQFEINRQLSPRHPITLSKLNKSFKKAQNKYRQEAEKAYAFIEQQGELLDKHFNLGWGNRLERQMKSYVPVVIAAGGNLVEATDSILATKLLRKLKDRYDNRPEDLKKLRSQLKTGFEGLQLTEKTSQSIRILDYELHRLGED